MLGNRFFRRSAYQGHIDGCTNGVLHGWAHRKNNKSPIAIDIFIAGRKIYAEVLCDQDRADLRDAGVGHGMSGFSVMVDPKVNGTDVLIEIFVANTKTRIATQILAVIYESHIFDYEPQAFNYEPQAFSHEPQALIENRVETVTETEIRGWAVEKHNPGAVFDVDILINGTYFCTARNDTPRGDLKKFNLSKGLGGIKVDLPFGLLKTGPVSVVFKLPKGTSEEWREDVICHGQSLIAPILSIDTSVSIIVPIYNAFEDLEICIERLLAYTTHTARLILINDASTDKAIAHLLAQYKSYSNITVLNNKRNMGFTRTVNKGIEAAGTDDVIFLNSDARVTPQWLEGLRAAAASDPRIGTITPLSDRAGAFSAPKIGNNNPLPLGVSEAEFAVAVRRSSLKIYPTVPTGNGFCMYVRRACLNAVGLLDEKAFPRGYGEENDFCMRAGRKGWRNIIDDSTYVFHERSKSFGGEKTKLMAQGRAVIDARYPDYKTQIEVFNSGPNVLMARYRAGIARLECSSSGNAQLPRALFVVSTSTGGTPQTNRDLMHALSPSWDCWILRCNSKTLVLEKLTNGVLQPIETYHLQERVSPTSHRSFEYDHVVTHWLGKYDFTLVHIRQLIWHSLSLPALAKATGAVVINSFHDFYTLCPSIKLLDENNIFCDGNCTKTKGECENDMWPNSTTPALKNNWVNTWRSQFEDALSVCDAFVTTSPSARERLTRFMPKRNAARFVVIPHGRDFSEMQQSSKQPSPDRPIKILVPGNISTAKGLAVIASLLEHDAVAQRLEFHILGHHDFFKPRRGFIAHGLYKRADFAARVESIAPDVGAVFSIWDETYCHTLTEMWAAGLPVIGLDYGTVGARIRDSDAGWVFQEQDSEKLYSNIIKRLNDLVEFNNKLTAVSAWQHNEGRANTIRTMASKYQALYQSTIAHVHAQNAPFQAPADEKYRPKPLIKKIVPRIAVVAPAYMGLDDAPASTHVRIWSRCFNTPERRVSYVRMTSEELIASVRTGDIKRAIIQRNAIPIHLLDAVKNYVEAGQLRYVLDLDDDLLSVPRDKDPDGIYALYTPVLKQLIKMAKMVFVPTDALAEKICTLNKAVHIIPNRLSGRIWRGDLPPRQDDGKIRALYMGTRSHDNDFALVYPAFEALAKTHSNLRLRLIGAIEVRPKNTPTWLEIVEIPDTMKTYPNFVQWLKHQCGDFDFGIAPLENSDFNACKSYLKVLDYNGLGLPVLASNHPVYAPLKGAPNLHLVKNTTRNWTAALQKAVATGPIDVRKRQEAYKWLEHSHMLESTLHSFDKLLISILR